MRTISKVYDSYAQAKRAVQELERAGVPSDAISLVANKHVSREHADVNDVSDAASSGGVAQRPRAGFLPMETGTGAALLSR